MRGGVSVTDAVMLSGLARSTVYKYAKVRMPEFARLRLPIYWEVYSWLEAAEN